MSNKQIASELPNGTPETPAIIANGLYESRKRATEVLDVSRSRSEFEAMSRADLVEWAMQAKVALGDNKRMSDEYVKLIDNQKKIITELRNGTSYVVLKERIKELENQVIIDELTGIHNRRYLNEEGTKDFERSEREKKPLTVGMVDIDHFKIFNDTYGHEFGDKVLSAVAQLMEKEIRGFDTVARYGGEEFTLVFPNTDTEDASMIMHRIKEKIRDLKFEFKGKEVGVTVSIGAATFSPDAQNQEFSSVDELIKKADGELYTAKRSGRDRISFAKPKE